jgi:hypothetical protein
LPPARRNRHDRVAAFKPAGKEDSLTTVGGKLGATFGYVAGRLNT